MLSFDDLPAIKYNFPTVKLTPHIESSDGVNKRPSFRYSSVRDDFCWRNRIQLVFNCSTFDICVGRGLGLGATFECKLLFIFYWWPDRPLQFTQHLLATTHLVRFFNFNLVNVVSFDFASRFSQNSRQNYCKWKKDAKCISYLCYCNCFEFWEAFHSQCVVVMESE